MVAVRSRTTGAHQVVEVTRRGRESCQMQADGDIYMKNAAGRGEIRALRTPVARSKTIKLPGDRSEITPSPSRVECLI